MLAWGASVPTLGGVTPLWAMPTNAARCTARHCMSGSAHTEELCTQFWQHAWRGSHALGSCIHDRRVRGNYYRSLEPPRRQQANPGARTGSGHSAEPRAVGRHKFDDHPGRQQHVNHGDDWAPVKFITPAVGMLNTLPSLTVLSRTSPLAQRNPTHASPRITSFGPKVPATMRDRWRAIPPQPSQHLMVTAA